MNVSVCVSLHKKCNFAETLAPVGYHNMNIMAVWEHSSVHDGMQSIEYSGACNLVFLLLKKYSCMMENCYNHRYLHEKLPFKWDNSVVSNEPTHLYHFAFYMSISYFAAFNSRKVQCAVNIDGPFVAIDNETHILRRVVVYVKPNLI